MTPRHAWWATRLAYPAGFTAVAVVGIFVGNWALVSLGAIATIELIVRVNAEANAYYTGYRDGVLVMEQALNVLGRGDSAAMAAEVAPWNSPPTLITPPRPEQP